MTFSDYSDLGLFHRSCRHVAVLDLWWVQFFLVVSDPGCDAQEDAQSVQTVHVPWVRLGRSDQDVFRLGLAQDKGERLQKDLKVTFTQKHTHCFLIGVVRVHLLIMLLKLCYANS